MVFIRSPKLSNGQKLFIAAASFSIFACAELTAALLGHRYIICANADENTKSYTDYMCIIYMYICGWVGGWVGGCGCGCGWVWVYININI